MNKHRRRPWLPDEDETLRRLYPDLETAALAILLQRSDQSIYHRARQLRLQKSAAYLASPAACRLRRGGYVGRETRFQPGHTSWNAGLKGYEPGGRSVETRFKKGHKPTSWVPIGAERMMDGYRQRKVTDTGYPPRDWVGLHILLWREHHGPIPEGHVVVFRDGNRAHISLENLELISRAENMRRNTIHRYPPELQSAMKLVTKLNRAIDQRTEDEEQNDRPA